MKKISLKKAREQGKLDQFIKEHENDPPGDSDKLRQVINKVAKSDEKKKIKKRSP